MNEMLAKLINEGKREHEEMEIFIKEFRTTNELLLKDHNNLLSELKIKVNELSRVMNEVLFSKHQVKGVTTRDLGASRSLMPYTMYEKLGLGEPKPTRMSLELADMSIQYPRGIVENVLIKVDKFVLPIDFVILDMPEDSRILIILGRPFLATVRAMIDVFHKKITLKVGDDEVVFDIERSIKKPSTEDDECYSIVDLNETINEETRVLLDNDHLYSFLLNNLEKTITQSDQENCDSIENEGVKNISNEHLYSASANKIDEKKPELKDLPSHLEYAYLHNNESFPVIISSKLSEKGKDFSCGYWKSIEENSLEDV
ncbi:DNA-directed DNA polymerase [Tanacetum coccineum]